MIMGQAIVMDMATAQNNFAQLGSQARQAPIQVTRRGKVEFVVISPELFEALKASGAASISELERMQASFRKMVRRMQRKRSEAAFDAVVNLSAGDLPDAVANAHKKLDNAAHRRRANRK